MDAPRRAQLDYAAAGRWMRCTKALDGTCWKRDLILRNIQNEPFFDPYRARAFRPFSRK
jgi:hypothetical protein